MLDDEDSTRPFPVDLVVIARHITHVRVQAQTRDASALQHRMQRLFQEIAAFDPDAWAEQVDIFRGDMTPAIGQIFQTATRLYGIVALPASITSPPPPPPPPLVAVDPGVTRATGPGSVCDGVRVELLERLRDTWPSLSDSTNMSWPLLVAGVALADGPAEDQEFVARCLDELWREPLHNITPLLGLTKLRRFWQSGKREWEDCFDEPVPW